MNSRIQLIAPETLLGDASEEDLKKGGGWDSF